MTRHQTVQPNQSVGDLFPRPAPPAISGAPTSIPVPPRDPRLNDLATGGGGGNLGPAGAAINPARLPEGGGPAVTDESDAS
jgi:hypothetical protein